MQNWPLVAETTITTSSNDANNNNDNSNRNKDLYHLNEFSNNNNLDQYRYRTHPAILANIPIPVLQQQQQQQQPQDDGSSSSYGRINSPNFLNQDDHQLSNNSIGGFYFGDKNFFSKRNYYLKDSRINNKNLIPCDISDANKINNNNNNSLDNNNNNNYLNGKSKLTIEGSLNSLASSSSSSSTLISSKYHHPHQQQSLFCKQHNRIEGKNERNGNHFNKFIEFNQQKSIEKVEGIKEIDCNGWVVDGEETNEFGDVKQKLFIRNAELKGAYNFENVNVNQTKQDDREDCVKLMDNNMKEGENLNLLKEKFEFLINKYLINEIDKINLSYYLNEFETNKCDLSKLLTNLLENLLIKLPNSLIKYQLLYLIRELYIKNNDFYPQDENKFLLQQNENNNNNNNLKFDEKYKLDLRLFDATIQRYLMENNVTVFQTNNHQLEDNYSAETTNNNENIDSTLLLYMMELNNKWNRNNDDDDDDRGRVIELTRNLSFTEKSREPLTNNEIYNNEKSIVDENCKLKVGYHSLSESTAATTTTTTASLSAIDDDRCYYHERINCDEIYKENGQNEINIINNLSSEKETATAANESRARELIKGFEFIKNKSNKQENNNYQEQNQERGKEIVRIIRNEDDDLINLIIQPTTARTAAFDTIHYDLDNNYIKNNFNINEYENKLQIEMNRNYQENPILYTGEEEVAREMRRRRRKEDYFLILNEERQAERIIDNNSLHIDDNNRMSQTIVNNNNDNQQLYYLGRQNVNNSNRLFHYDYNGLNDDHQTINNNKFISENSFFKDADDKIAYIDYVNNISDINNSDFLHQFNQVNINSNQRLLPPPAAPPLSPLENRRYLTNNKQTLNPFNDLNNNNNNNLVVLDSTANLQSNECQQYNNISYNNLINNDDDDFQLYNAKHQTHSPYSPKQANELSSFSKHNGLNSSIACLENCFNNEFNGHSRDYNSFHYNNNTLNRLHHSQTDLTTFINNNNNNNCINEKMPLLKWNSIYENQTNSENLNFNFNNCNQNCKDRCCSSMSVPCQLAPTYLFNNNNDNINHKQEPLNFQHQNLAQFPLNFVNFNNNNNNQSFIDNNPTWPSQVLEWNSDNFINNDNKSQFYKFTHQNKYHEKQEEKFFIRPNGVYLNQNRIQMNQSHYNPHQIPAYSQIVSSSLPSSPLASTRHDKLLAKNSRKQQQQQLYASQQANAAGPYWDQQHPVFEMADSNSINAVVLTSSSSANHRSRRHRRHDSDQQNYYQQQQNAYSNNIKPPCLSLSLSSSSRQQENFPSDCQLKDYQTTETYNNQQLPRRQEQSPVAILAEQESDEEFEEEDESDNNSVLSVVAAPAEAHLPLSIAEQMKEQANNFVQQYGSARKSSSSSSRAQSGLRGKNRQQQQQQQSLGSNINNNSSGAGKRCSSSSSNHSVRNNRNRRRLNLQVRRTLRVKIKKSKPILGIAIEGGFNVSGQLLPRIVCVHEDGAAYQCGKLRASDLILEVNGTSTVNMTHNEIAKTIANAYYHDSRPYIEFLIGESVHV